MISQLRALRDAQALCNHLLDVVHPLRRRENVIAILSGDDDAGLRLHVQVVLALDRKLTVESEGGSFY